jgi:two-component system phosphate regulon sensor histidine kinase PhoR
MLEDTRGLTDEVRGHLVTVQRNSRRLHRLVDDLLSTALHSVATVIDLRRTSVHEQLRRSAFEAGKAAESAGLTLELQVAAGCEDLAIEGDAERLAQVFDNLFSNAVKYTPPGGEIVASLSKEGGCAVVRVMDTGRGISEGELTEIFTKFFRAQTALTDAIPGVGLGLAITKSIVDGHGGEIHVTSEFGEGTTFEVRLPLAEAPAFSS